MGKSTHTDLPDDAGDGTAHKAATWFAHLLDPATPQSDYARFRDWLEADESHAEAYARIERLWGQAAAEPLRAGGTRRTFLKTAGGVVLLAGIGAAWTAGMRRPDFSTGTGEIRTVSLPDGSTAQLSAGSAISIDFHGSTRSVVLHAGEAYFTVAPNAGRPFIVEAGPLKATALGTAYSVAITPERLSVAVTEHDVRVEVDTQRLDLGEGDAVDYEKGRLGTVIREETEGRLGWRKRQLVFLARPLGEVVAELNRWRAGRLVVLDQALADRRVTAIIDVNDIARIDRTLEQGLPITLTHYTPLLTVVSARR
ncbi:transmembrane sensor [Neorhizobium huautlense]|uniref:Transmembrane sensor n=1 Tax=Neorhizobium huautlense TaxID=67774 RepID=A0ABT9PM11_9HYPH|nr:FecR domain-containing protein [Neorhizobium huautlense]MDP9835486.1 transmembrane sensor [Neorhizobium huautlense]